jgi:HD-GYP domain-containing protein (c-di-GMP phosphodiesterase class II)
MTYCAMDRQADMRAFERAGITPEELQRLEWQAGTTSLCQREDLPACLWPLLHDSISSFLVVPLVINESVAGFVWLGFDDARPAETDMQMHAGQIANQVAVALSKARLVQELEQLNQGTLMALARAIDMKSRWTAGHSERVTHIAVRIGRAMQLPQAELDDLYRGSLIHDIGKIGIPSKILDKPGRLSTEERRLIQEHPHLGARILEPIKPYAGIIRLVAQHHELYDGSGYPEGLAGNQIILPARILAVADVCDALLSDRPYRPGSALDVVIEYMQLQSGKQFDPAVVAAFLQTIDSVRMEYAPQQTDEQEIMTLLQEHPQGSL